MADINVRTEAFEGPMALLCRLIEKNEINIHDIPISFLTEEYLKSVRAMDIRDMDGMSEFALMAATLIEIKSRTLLPKAAKEAERPEDGVDPRDELVRRITEYRRFKEAAALLGERGAAFFGAFFRGADGSVPPDIMAEYGKPDVGGILGGVTGKMLLDAFVEAMSRREGKTDRIRGGFTAVTREAFSVGGKKEHIAGLLRERGRIPFADAFPIDAGKLEVIVTFLALLELVRSREAAAEQGEDGEIFIKRLHSR